MKFRNAYTEKIPFPCPSGSRYRKNYKRGLNENGEKILVQDGVEDVYDSIQKAAAGNTIDDLLRRAQAGDTDAVPEVIESYADLTNMPSDLLSAHKMLYDSEVKFNSLPADLKAKFGNNFGTFLKGLGNGTVAALLQPNSNAAASSSSGTSSLSEDEINKVREMLNGGNN